MLLARIVAGLAGAFFAYWSLIYFGVVFQRFDAIGLGIGVVAGLIAAFLGWFVLFADIPHERLRMVWTLIIGSGIGLVSFVAGYFEPMVFTSAVSQAPLLSIFIIGPLGFLAGCVAGFAWTRLKM
jgi:hypothetical protein